MTTAIEIFPALKSCDQGCPPCPLARKDNERIHRHIDPEVQTTFSALENAFHLAHVRYDMHLSSSFDLTPMLHHPDLIEMARFMTNKSIRNPGAPIIYAENMRLMLQNRGVDPSTIGYSIVPPNPVVHESDIDLIREINRHIGNWYFQKPDKTIDVTIRSNLIKMQRYEESIPAVFAADTILLNSLIKEYGRRTRHIARMEDLSDGRMYVNVYESIAKRGSVSICNRVIAARYSRDSRSGLIKQAMSLYPGSKKQSVLDYAIAPKGVMLMHSSLAINNPILWINHKDFRSVLSEELDKKGKKFSPYLFIKSLMQENMLMYRFFTAKDQGNEPIDFMGSFESSRKSIREVIYKKGIK